MAATVTGLTLNIQPQSLLDLYSFQQQLGHIDGVKLLVLGHLTQRCSHSLLLSLAKFENVEVPLFSEHGALLDRQEEEELRSLGLNLRYVHWLEEAVPFVDAIYVTGMKEDPDYPVPEAFIDNRVRLLKQP